MDFEQSRPGGVYWILATGHFKTVLTLFQDTQFKSPTKDVFAFKKPPQVTVDLPFLRNFLRDTPNVPRTGKPACNLLIHTTIIDPLRIRYRAILIFNNQSKEKKPVILYYLELFNFFYFYMICIICLFCK